MTLTPDRPMAESRRMAARLAQVVPGGAHTYAKGPDQYPADIAPVIARGAGSHVWDVDGNEYVEFGSGLRSVSLGHGHPAVLAAVRRQLELGANFARPAAIELDAAERFLETVPSADMVKFTKNGSDATSAAIRLARAVTGRDLVLACKDQPFFSTDDWFIGTTPMSAGIPDHVSRGTLTFPYGDIAATRELLTRHEGLVACLILEAATQRHPPEGYLVELIDLAHEHGALLVLDEMITGFRLARAGAQGRYGITPDLSTFGKAFGNGFAVSALAGRRELMARGGFDHHEERVFLLSTTHGAETHALAAAIAVMDVYEREDIVAQLNDIGGRLASSVRAVVAAAGLEDYVRVLGLAPNLVFATLGPDGKPSQEYRTLFMRELLLNGVLAPSFVVSSATTDADLETTVRAVDGACRSYVAALDHGDPGPWLGGRPVRPVFRQFA